MVAMRNLSVVPNQLKAANHLAHREETEELGDQDTAASDLAGRDVAESLTDCRR